MGGGGGWLYCTCLGLPCKCVHVLIAESGRTKFAIRSSRCFLICCVLPQQKGKDRHMSFTYGSITCPLIIEGFGNRERKKVKNKKLAKKNGPVSSVCHLPDSLILFLSLKIIHNSHLTHIATKILLMHSFSGNCAASAPISTFMCLRAIYIFPWSVHIFGCCKIDRPILEIYKSLTDIWVQELGDKTL